MLSLEQLNTIKEIMNTIFKGRGAPYILTALNHGVHVL